MSAETITALWKEARSGLIQEVEKIPEDQFSFRATPETRSIAELLQHVISSQKMLVGEVCRPDTNLMRQSFAAHAEEYARGVNEVNDKNGLLELLRNGMDESEQKINSYCDKLDETMVGFQGHPLTKTVFLTFAVSHEMYHRGQLTVYQRLLNIEPVLTVRLKKMFANAG
ncbi:MAG TPA: DinB family protein [Pyrinomonadaceae bacterium]|nr:DinB family protein [Pyrinomonadaceae bacterium]